MTEQRQIEIRAELARRMGWTHVISGAVGFCPKVSRQLAYCHDAFKKYICGHMKRPIPDPFTDAADSRALVAWLAADADDARFLAFRKELFLIWLTVPNEQALTLGYYEKWLLTLPLETITLAAAKALGIETE